MSYMLKRSPDEGKMVGRIGSRRALTMNPKRTTVDDFPPRHVVTDMIDQRPLYPRKNLLEGFQDERIDYKMIQRREIGGKRHIVKVIIRLWSAKGGVD